MITQDFESGKKVTFDNFGVSFDDGHGAIVWLSTGEFSEFMPVALLVYHQNMPQPCYGGAQIAPAAAVKPAAKKRGRPATKPATAKRGRPRKA